MAGHVWTQEQRDRALQTRMTNAAAKREAKALAAAEPKVPLTETAEFKAAVAAAAAEAARGVLAELTAARPQIAAASSDDVGTIMQRLAMNIAELTDQGVGMQRIPAEIIQARAKAHARMVKIIAAAERDGKVATYRLVGKCVLPVDGSGETLVDPLQRGADNKVSATKIRWAGVPNLAMEPINEIAAEIMAAFRESIGNQVPAEVGVETNLGLTDQGHVVMGGGIQQRKDRSADRPRLGSLIIDDDGVAIPNGGGPAYVDVHVLGSIAAPARQNG